MRAWGDLPGDDPEGERAADRRRDGRRHRGRRDRPRPAAARRAPATTTRRTRATTPTRTSTRARVSRRSSASSEPGAVGTALGVALSRGGWPIHAVASRDAGRRERFRSLVDVARVFADPEPILDEVELIILAVPDDAIAPAGRFAPDVRRPGDDPHQRRARGRGPRPGHGRRDPDRRVPSARRVRRHRTGRRGPPRRDGRDRGRRPAGRACSPTWPRRSARRPSAWRPARRPPITRRRSWPPAGSSRCSTRSPSSDGWPASTRRARSRSTGRSSRGRSATPGRSGSAPR